MMNDSNFDLVTPTTLNSKWFEQNALKTLKIISKRFSFNKNSQTYLLTLNLPTEIKTTELKLERFGLKNGIATCFIS